MSLFMLLPMAPSSPISLTLGGYTATSKESNITQVTNRLPIVAFRVNTDGNLDKALGHTQAGLSYSQVAQDYLINSDAGSLYEAKLDVTGTSGPAGTMVGTTGSWVAPQHTWTWTKDTDGVGSAQVTVTLAIREVADTSNVVTVASQIWLAVVDL